nr:MAG TPA: Monokaryotic chloroplast 1 junction resolvase, DNA BINDING.86A [Caudoviricetes sp.]
MTTTIIAIDPGVSTGLVAAYIDDSGVVEIKEFDQRTFSDYTDTVDWILQVIDKCYRQTNSTPIVVCEQFDLRPGNKFNADLTPVKINAVLEYKLPRVVFQIPAQAKGLVKDSVLKNIGWWATGKTIGQKDANDVRDALRHLVYYLVHVEKNHWVLELGWPR